MERETYCGTFGTARPGRHGAVRHAAILESMTVRHGTALLLVLALLTACGGEPDGPAAGPDEQQAATAPSSPSAADPSPSDAPPQRRTRGTRVVVADSEFGPMLFDRTGQAIYLFDVETSAQPRCYGACAEAWPPVLTTGVPVAGRGVDAGLLSTTERRDGSRQVTYAGHPLYFYAHEGKHEVKCHDVFLNGGTWYVVRPDGRRAS